MTREETEKYAFFMFGNEFDCLKTSDHLHAAGNHADANEQSERADSFLDSGWEALETLEGYRPRDIARFRHATHEQWPKVYPLTLPIQIFDPFTDTNALLED